MHPRQWKVLDHANLKYLPHTRGNRLLCIHNLASFIDVLTASIIQDVPEMQALLHNAMETWSRFHACYNVNRKKPYVEGVQNIAKLKQCECKDASQAQKVRCSYPLLVLLVLMMFISSKMTIGS